MSTEHGGRRGIDHGVPEIGRRTTDTLNSWVSLGNNVWKLLGALVISIAFLVGVYYKMSNRIDDARAAADQTYATKQDLKDVVEAYTKRADKSDTKLDDLIKISTKTATIVEDMQKRATN